MKVQLKNKITVFFAFLVAIFTSLLTADILFSIFSESFVVPKNPEALIFVLAISTAFIVNKNRQLSVFVLTFFTIIQFAQFCHIKYFGTLISPAALYLMMREVSDVVEESVSVFWNYICILPVVVLPYIALYKLAHNKYTLKYKCHSSITVCIFLFAISLPLFIAENRSPNANLFSLENSVRAIIGYTEVVAGNHKFKSYMPYSVEKIRDINEPTTIVYILGESTNVDHMSLFGYSEDTTPELKKLAQNRNFYCTIGIAGGVVTMSSSKFMCNAIREPDNVKETALDTVNLFRLAKLNGFKTFYISAKRSDMISSVGGMPYMDVVITREQYLSQFSNKRDSLLLELVNEQEFSDKNFIVIHQRCIHAPYTKTVPQSFVPSKKFSGNKNDTINKYDDAMLYNDSVIAGLFDIFNKFKGKFYIFFASDHNELMGKNGKWGHGLLDPETAKIPVLVQSNDDAFMNEIRKIFAITHYDICCKVANLLGFKIINPNEERDIYYINGVDFTGRCGYIKFRKDYKNKKIEYFTD